MVRRRSVGGCKNNNQDGVILHGFRLVISASGAKGGDFKFKGESDSQGWEWSRSHIVSMQYHLGGDDFDPSHKPKVNFGLKRGPTFAGF